MKNIILIYLGLIALVTIFYLTLPDNKAKVIVCDVGQGDAILATYKNIQILVDVGPDNKKVLRCLQNHLPFWDKTIEVVILTHGDNDHVGGLDDLLRSYKVNKFFSNGLLVEEIEQKIYSQKVNQNDIISIGLFDFEVVSPELNNDFGNNDNENSVAGILRYKSWSMFMSGDMEVETEQRLVWREILRLVQDQVEVLKVSHHGSNTGTSDEMLKVLKPKVAVISVGKNNQFGHPNNEVLNRLNTYGVLIRRTDEEGNLVFVLN